MAKAAGGPGLRMGLIGSFKGVGGAQRSKKEGLAILIDASRNVFDSFVWYMNQNYLNSEFMVIKLKH